MGITDLTHKPISRKIAGRYGVKVDGNDVIYPYHDETGVIVAAKRRSLPKGFSWDGMQKAAGLFGQKACIEGGKMLVVTEGEDDTMAAAEMFDQQGKRYNVVSIPNGANADGRLDAQTKRSIEFLTSFEKVILCLDNDENGLATAKGLAEILVAACEVRLVSLPDGFKDAGDMLMADRGAQFLQCINTAKRYSPEGVIHGEEVSLDDIMRATRRGLNMRYPKLSEKMGGFRKGELTLLTAGSGLGKSTVAREMAYDLSVTHGLKVANIFLEEPMIKSAQSYIAIDNDVPLAKFREDPSILPIEKVEASKAKVVDNMLFYNHFGSMKTELLMSKLRYFAIGCEADVIVLDHISMVVSGQKTNDERKALDLIMTELATFVTETGCHVIAIVHLKRAQGKSFNEGSQISLNDLRGSGGLEQMSFNVIGIERDQQDEEKSSFMNLRILKCRETGDVGKADLLTFNKKTGRIDVYEDEEF